MVIDGRGEKFSAAYDQFEGLITQEGCLLKDVIEIWVDSEAAAKKINILATLTGYDSVAAEREDYWTLTVDVSHRRCL